MMRFWLGIVFGLAAFAQANTEPPVALVINAENAELVRANSELPLAAKPGDILFAGDVLRIGAGSTVVVSCSERKQITLGANTVAAMEAGQVRVRSGKAVDEKNVSGCHLPPLPRSIVASQQHVIVASDERREVAAGAQNISATSELSSLAASEGAGPVNHLGRAEIFEKYGLNVDAAAEMREVVAAWPDAAWARSRLFVLEEQAGKSAAPKPAKEGQTFALLVGISNFKDPRIRPLQFAHQDAIDLAELLRSPRGGAIPEQNIVLLTNEMATTSAVRQAIETQLKARAGKDDTVLLFIASHGMTLPVQNREQGFIVTYDMSPEDPATTAIPMDDLRSLFESELTSARRLFLFVDVCHAGHVGQIFPKADAVNRTAERTLTAERMQMFGMLAAQKSQVAVEGVVYGGGHGAFTYFLLRALNGDADFNGDKKVTMDELAQFVEDKVREATANRQIPKTIGEIDETRAMAYTDRTGIQLKEYMGQVVTASRDLQLGALAKPSVVQQPAARVPASRALRYEDATRLVEDFESAIGQDRLSPTADRSAFTYLPALKARLAPELYRQEADKLRVALEDKGQEVILRYLAGEQSPQKRDDFLNGRAYFEGAQLLAPDSVYLESRLTFCEGRVAIFDKNYARASDLLERAIRLDPERGYSYNALGISYLERAAYDRAILAFREASRRAPYWAYPWHNMALALAEKGDYQQAIEAYQRTMSLAPNAAYVPYNLGLLYQRMNRRKDAETSFRKALSLSPDNAEIFNALGYLNASSGHADEAERLYRTALEKDPRLLAARHNLAVLLAANPKRANEAIALWRRNLAQSADYLPSRLSLARALVRSGDDTGASREYEAIVQAKPEYGAARLALADLYLKMGQNESALSQLQEALRREPDSPEILERLGDAYRASNQPDQARSFYNRALGQVRDPAAKKRVRARLKAL